MSWILVSSLLAWAFLLVARAGFWRARPVIEDERVPDPPGWPGVTAIVPARNEAATVEVALRTVLEQDYLGPLCVVLVDDHSDDGTGTIAKRLAAEAGDRLQVVDAPPLPDGWTGKVWALQAGLDQSPERAPFIWLTDADIAHDSRTLRRLVAKANESRLDLVSLMVRLDVATPIERLLIPPFVFFFQKLYPFPAVNDPRSAVAAAAGGCALVRREALRTAGGLAAIRGELIDDVALARTIKRRPDGLHPIWLGHGRNERSLRRYTRLGEIWSMVARSADEQLGHSLALLVLTVAGMALLYLVPVLGLFAGALGGGVLPGLIGLAACILMMTAYAPTAELYGVGWRWRLTLPVAAALYALMTLSSAWRFRRHGGSVWKGRTHHPV